VALLDHEFHDFGERGFDIECDDVNAWHHDIRGGLVVHFQDVADQHPLVFAQRPRVVDCRLINHPVESLAQALAIAGTPDQPKEIAQRRERPIRLACWRRLGITHRACVHP